MLLHLLVWVWTASCLLLTPTVCDNTNDEESEDRIAYRCLDYENYNQMNVWFKGSTCEYSGSAIPAGRYFHASALYRRGPHWAREQHKDKADRMLVFSGITIKEGHDIKNTWLYTPSINSWYQHAIDVEPPRRHGHSLTTLCVTEVMLFGGRNESTELRDTWLFDGVTETWMEISPFTPSGSAPARKFHSALAMSQPKSSCPCKESVVV